MDIGDSVKLKGRHRQYVVLAFCQDDRRVWIGRPATNGSVWVNEQPFITNLDALEVDRPAVIDETPSPSFL